MTEAGFSFTVLPPNDGAEPSQQGGESPGDYVRRLARLKAENVAARVESGCVIGCDTVVVYDGRILGKPTDRSHAKKILQTLRGTKHTVLSGLCLILKTSPSEPVYCRTDQAETELFMESITDADLEEYLDTNAWQGKAGAFGYQERHDWIRLVHGSESNVVGLPMELLAEMLAESDRRGDFPRGGNML